MSGASSEAAKAFRRAPPRDEQTAPRRKRRACRHLLLRDDGDEDLGQLALVSLLILLRLRLRLLAVGVSEREAPRLARLQRRAEV